MRLMLLRRFLPTYLEGGNGVDNGDTEILTNPWILLLMQAMTNAAWVWLALAIAISITSIAWQPNNIPNALVPSPRRSWTRGLNNDLGGSVKNFNIENE